MESKIKGLEKLVKNVSNRYSNKKKPEVFEYLNEQLNNYFSDGEVESLLVYDGHGKINCYGRRIREILIFQKLNLTIGTKGTSLTGIVSYPGMHLLTSYQHGDFVCREEFTNRQEDKDSYVALINIDVNPDQQYFGF